MTSFESLQTILDMDFTAMRALPCEGGMRASDEAITAFVTNLNLFFNQFQIEHPTPTDLSMYQTLMTAITEKISLAELTYYLEKYQNDEPDARQSMAEQNKLSSFKEIPRRMQYWAAGETFGDTIRDAKNHIKAINHMNHWKDLIEPAQSRSPLQPLPTLNFFKRNDEAAPPAVGKIPRLEDPANGLEPENLPEP